MNNFKYSNTNKRYHTFSYYLKDKYNSKVAKLALDGGFSCPNRDGTKSVGGCDFCGDHGSGENTTGSHLPIKEQIKIQKEVQIKKWPTAKFIAYFQNYTNTYDSLENIKRRFDEIIGVEDIVALSIGTRPDCISGEVLKYLNSLTKHFDVWIEMGLQTIHKDTFNRSYDLNEYTMAMKKISKTKIKTCVHIINGLPNESKEMMVKTAKFVSDSGVDSMKIHSLFITKNTKFADDYTAGKLLSIERGEYIDVVIAQLRVIHEGIVIQRITGDPDKESFIAPQWATNKRSVINDIDKEMARRDIYQGDKK